MNEQNSTPSAKLISHVLLDFSSEAEMELFINYVEKTGANFYENMKKIGLMRFRLNQVWNKEGGFALSSLFEYKDENAYLKGQKVIEKHFKENENFFKKITVKRLTTRTFRGRMPTISTSKPIRIHSASNTISAPSCTTGTRVA